MKRDGTCAETRFGLSEKWTSPFKSTGESVQSTAGSRGVRISGQTMDRPCSEAQCKSSGYSLQSPISPSLPLPRVTMCHHVSNGLYILQHSERTHAPSPACPIAPLSPYTLSLQPAPSCVLKEAVISYTLHVNVLHVTHDLKLLLAHRTLYLL